MAQQDADLWDKVEIDPTHLTEEELQYECTIRAVYHAGLATTALQAQLKYSLAQEKANQQDTIEMFKVAPDSDTLQADFEALLTNIANQSSQFFSAIASPEFEAPILMSRLQHYKLRLQRFPTELYDSIASANTRKLFNDLARIASKIQRAPTAEAVVNEIIDGLQPTAQLNSTVIAQDVNTRTEESRHDQSQATNQSYVHVPLAQPTLNAEEIQTSESFRMSPHFQTFANQPTPPCARGVAPSVHFQAAPEQASSYSQIQIRSPQTDWSFQSRGIPHSTRTATATVSSTNTQPTAMRQHAPGNYTQANTIRMLPAEAHHASDQPNGSNRTFSDSYIRQAGSELQALKRWLGAKTFEGELVDTKHFSIDEFLSNLQLCVQSGICSEQTMLRNLAPAFSGRAFKWWTTTHGRVQNFHQLAQSLKMRFATYAGSVEGLMSAIYGRRQQKHESLPDFVDTMQQLMDQLPDQFDDARRISTIISCALPEDAKLLRSRYYADIVDFTRHVAFLSQDKPKHTHERYEKRSNREKSVFSCEVNNDESDSSSEEGEPTPIDVQAITAAFQKSLSGLKFRRPSKPSDQKKARPQSDHTGRSKEKPTSSSDTNGQTSKFHCFGCGAPDVYMANCKTCQAKKNETPKREIFCFGCGAANIYFSDCGKCQDKLPKNERPALDNATTQALAK